MVVIPGSEQLTSSEVKDSHKTMGEVSNGGRGHEFEPEGTHNQHSPKWSGSALFNS